MKLIFAESVHSKLEAALRANPDAVGIELTLAELVAVYDEVLASKDPSNAILISGKERIFILDGKTYWVRVR